MRTDVDIGQLKWHKMRRGLFSVHYQKLMLIKSSQTLCLHKLSVSHSSDKIIQLLILIQPNRRTKFMHRQLGPKSQ